jgi:hypothetical protein
VLDVTADRFSERVDDLRFVRVGLSARLDSRARPLLLITRG